MRSSCGRSFGYCLGMVGILFFVGVSGVAQDAQDATVSVRTRDGNTLKGTILSIAKDDLTVESQYGELIIQTDSVTSVTGTWIRVEADDGSIVQGLLVELDDERLSLYTDVGRLQVARQDIQIVSSFRTDVLSDVKRWGGGAIASDSTAVPNAQRNQVSDISRLLLYEQQRKNVGTAMMFQTLGAGLIYAEQTGLGITMLLAEWGLVVAPLFVQADWAPYLTYAGAGLRAVNLFTTIRAVNDYNARLAQTLNLPRLQPRSASAVQEERPEPFVYQATYPGYTINGEDISIATLLERIADGEEKAAVPPSLARSYLERIQRQRRVRTWGLVGMAVGNGIVLIDYFGDQSIGTLGMTMGLGFTYGGALVFAGSLLFGVNASDIVDELNAAARGERL